MPGQLSATGAQALANHIGGIVPPHIGTSAPTWVPGLLWVDTTSGATLKYWNTAAWVAGTPGLYVALLTGDPSQSGLDGAYAAGIPDLVEDLTAGYARQAVTFTEPVSPGYPAVISNTATLTFGAYTAAQQLPVQWAALVTAVSGDLGLLLYMWTLPAPQQVGIAETIQIPAGDLTLGQS